MVDEKNILSIDHDDDDENLAGFNEFLDEDTQRKLSGFVSHVEEAGSNYLGEIERKKRNDDLRKKKYIPYILKHSNNTKEQLSSYTHKDILDMYNTLKYENRSFITKVLRFIFNL